MTELADKIEAAEAPSRELDAEIALAVKAVPYDMEPVNLGDAAEWRGIYDERFWLAPAYTASLDAALSLVPEGYYPQISKVKQNEWRVHLGYANRGPGVRSKAATPALALVAAALRAGNTDAG